MKSHLLHSSLALAQWLLAPAVCASEPPVREGLACTVARQSLDEGLRIEVAFSNSTGEVISLPPGPHLVLYRDSAASDAMDITARIDRIQRTAFLVPAHGSATALYGMDSRQADELLCNDGKPAAAGLYFYQFSRRPTFRCVLREFALASLPMKETCARADPLAPPGRPK